MYNNNLFAYLTIVYLNLSALHNVNEHITVINWNDLFVLLQATCSS
jgi:hypothetical protein